MAHKKTPAAQLEREITESLAKPRATDTNLFALTELVLRAGKSSFSNRLERVDYPHIKRTLAAGLVEADPAASLLRLTSEGRDVVLRRLRKEQTRMQQAAYSRPEDDRRRRQIDEAIAALERRS
jgi:hypothetical protein